MIQVKKDISCSQAKGTLLFVQIGTTGYFIGRCKGDGFARFEIDTPLQRFRMSVGKVRFAIKPNNQPGNSYRDRWLRKLGYVVQ